MVCCLCDASSGSCCCGGCGLDEVELSRQRQRAKMMEEMKKIKGLSRNSRAHLALDSAAVTEDARRRMKSQNAAACCGSSNAFGPWCLLVWLSLYGGILSFLHFRPVDLSSVLPAAALWALDSQTLSEFNRFFSWGVLLMMAVISAAFAFTALRICSFFSCIAAEVVGAAKEELKLDVCEAIDHDFYAFVRRLRDAFVTSEDFTLAAIRKAHRRLHALLRARISLVDLNVHGPVAVRRELESRIGCAQCCLMIFLLFLPWMITMCFNLAQLLLVQNSSIIGPQDAPLEALPEEASADALPAVHTPQSDEGLNLIAINLITNFLAVVYLSVVQKRCVERCFVSCMYPRIHKAVLDFCNRLICRTWEETVVDELVDFLEAPRTSYDRHDTVGGFSGLGLEEEQQQHQADAAAAAFSPSRALQQRLLTGESCGMCPTAHQAAVQAPCNGPRHKASSQCLALEPLTMWSDTASNADSGKEADYLELGLLEIPSFQEEKAAALLSSSSQSGGEEPRETHAVLLGGTPDRQSDMHLPAREEETAMSCKSEELPADSAQAANSPSRSRSH